MNCPACLEEATGLTQEDPLCAKCLEKMKTHFFVRCIACGSWGFLPINDRNVWRIRHTPAVEKILQTEHGFIIATAVCPTCHIGEYFTQEGPTGL